MRTVSASTRRKFLAAASASAGAAALGGGIPFASAATAAEAPPRTDPDRGLKLGVASFSLRKFPLDEALRMTNELGVKYITLKEFHLKLNSTREERQAVAKKVKDAGLTLMGGGVINLKKDEAQIRNAFEYARDCGMPLIVISPDPAALPTIDKMVKEFDIRAAIHNHGPGDKRFPSPMDVYRAVKPFDPRFGLCIDVGHTARLGENEVEAIRATQDRLLDLHIKDESARAKEGKPIEVGRGVIDVAGVLKALLEIRFQGHVALEYEKDADKPLAGMKESFEFIRKTLAEIG